MAFFCWVLKKKNQTKTTHTHKNQTKPKNRKAISKRKGKVEKSEAPQGLSLEHSPYEAAFPKTRSARKPLASVKEPTKYYGWGKEEDATRRDVDFLCYWTFVWITQKSTSSFSGYFPPLCLSSTGPQHRAAGTCGMKHLENYSLLHVKTLPKNMLFLLVCCKACG